MRAAVVAAFPGFTERFEGRVPYLYTDVKGLVTTGVGNLVEPVAAALGLPWKRADGSAATTGEVQAEWDKVKAAWPQTQSVADRAITSLHLEPADIDQLVDSKAKSNEQTIRGQFPGYDSWPADAQLAIHSMAWAQGPSFAGWPHLVAALNASPPDFAAAAGPPGDPANDTTARGQAWLNDAGNPGLRPRNLANKVLFQNAARAAAGGLDPETLYYPTELPAGATAPAASSRLLEVIAVLAVLSGAAVGFVRYVPSGQAWWKTTGRSLVARERRWLRAHEPASLRKVVPL